mmetsp:Transcript_40240/g.97150  ORF Transcript_40240/g.97150 Transcript_40240/m.97150 type:complete len:316 (+) Transcript_40240:165-1112(+)|eukprot:CAMPEP_0113643180 /NCGR_PEP_ID=MMETSP0017_2-20120614/22698_1 /TAXON_ID=2856 /ORGANISM="Cylindrotheca closterium" /LENGTH=315 /DNA_ID=CAMNT_0000554669 /DNA_START=118 /DNA_END=1065 /DNA_ORIENTATION=- /assembly_acc=CAM_ASM_000147
MPDKNALIGCGCVCACLLLVILLPLSFSYVEYYEYGLVQRLSTGAVDTEEVYTSGRYIVGPDKHFIKYQADAHLESLDNLGVFSKSTSNESIGLEFRLDVDFTYFLIEDEIGDVHREQASKYPSVISSRAQEAIKNSAAAGVTFTEFFQERKKVEALFRVAIQERWDSPPNLHARLDQLHLGRIKIPDTVATKQLEARVQNERNDREQFFQQAQIERELTKVEVNQINLETVKALRTAEAQASLIRTKAVAEAQLIREQAQINGTKNLLESVGITTQEHKTAYTYIKSLRNRNNMDLTVSYLAPESVLRTAAAGL